MASGQASLGTAAICWPIHYLSQVAMLYCALTIGRSPGGAKASAGRHRTAPRRFGLYLLYFLLVGLPLLNALQFTTTAFLATQAGLFSCLSRVASVAQMQPAAARDRPLLLAGLADLGRRHDPAGEPDHGDPDRRADRGSLLLREASRRTSFRAGWRGAAAMRLSWRPPPGIGRITSTIPQWHGFRSYNLLRGKFHDNAWTLVYSGHGAVFADSRMERERPCDDRRLVLGRR